MIISVLAVRWLFVVVVVVVVFIVLVVAILVGAFDALTVSEHGTQPLAQLSIVVASQPGPCVNEPILFFFFFIIIIFLRRHSFIHSFIR